MAGGRQGIIRKEGAPEERGFDVYKAADTLKKAGVGRMESPKISGAGQGTGSFLNPTSQNHAPHPLLTTRCQVTTVSLNLGALFRFSKPKMNQNVSDGRSMWTASEQ